MTSRPRSSHWAAAAVFGLLVATTAVLAADHNPDRSRQTVAANAPVGEAIAQAAVAPPQLPGVLRSVTRDVPAESPILSQLSGELENLSRHGLASVVAIRTVSAPQPSTGWNPFGFGTPNPQQRRGQGSGVIVSEDGLVATNHHVIDGAQQVEVALPDGRTVSAEVVGSDPATDVALVRLPAGTEGLTPIPFGDSSDVRVGALVVAIGNPFGLDGTVTMGIVSATGRSRVGVAEYEDFIQTDSAINPGNSGGALLDTSGRLIGINTAIASRSGGSQGIGFAVPSNMVREIIDDLADDGVVRRGWLGVAIADVSDKLTDATGVEAGAHVRSVEANSPAALAGLAIGDVITELERAPITDADALRYAIARIQPGTRVELGVLRGGARGSERITVELGERPARR